LRDPSEMFDSLYMIEVAAVHFFRRAELGRHIKGKKAAQVDADYEKAAYLAALAVPFRMLGCRRRRYWAIRTARCGLGTMPVLMKYGRRS
jgi:hypothetical protein